MVAVQVAAVAAQAMVPALVEGAAPLVHPYGLCTLLVCSGSLCTTGGQHSAAGIHCWLNRDGTSSLSCLNIEKVIINIKASTLCMNESNIYLFGFQQSYISCVY